MTAPCVEDAVYDVGAAEARRMAMVMVDPWPVAVRQAEEELGYRDPGIDRTVTGVREALHPKHRDAFDADLATLSHGISFEVFMDKWWTQAVVDRTHDEASWEAALEFADLAVALRISAGDEPTLSTAEVEEITGLHISAEAR